MQQNQIKMDSDTLQSTKEGDITQFLIDVRDYFKASLATSEYENTSNMFFMTASETTEELLRRCECLLNRLTTKNQIILTNIKTNGNNSPFPSTISSFNSKNSSIEIQPQIQNEDVSYLDMTAAHKKSDKENKSKEENNFDRKSFDGIDKTFRCSTLVVKQNKSFLHRTQETITKYTNEIANNEENENDADEMGNLKDSQRIYDTCQVSTECSDVEEDEVGGEEMQKVITSDIDMSLSCIDCPYIDLPAGHLSIQKSTKYGQLQRIEKRIFFDQIKKCYCGILNNWLLCYAEGPTANKPSITLYLKMPGIGIEHFGEGKRRDVCFQITTCDSNNRFIFQAVNEIDAKEWIHAIEAAIRSDIADLDIRNSSPRKLPTPPVMENITFMNYFQRNNEFSISETLNDSIYEEPSPIQYNQAKTNFISKKPPGLPQKQSSSLPLVQNIEYDVPKCPPQPLKTHSNSDENFIKTQVQNAQSRELDEKILSDTLLSSTKKSNINMEENLDFQTKVKDVHSKLTSQLSSGPIIKKSKKPPSLTSSTAAESSIVKKTFSSLTQSTAVELKKQKNSTQSSPQKSSNEKTSFTKTWFLNRLNKNTSSTRPNTSTPLNSPTKCKQSEKENLLNSTDVCDGYDIHDIHLSSNPTSPALKSSKNGISKVNMIINQLEASGHLASIFSVDAVSSFSSFCDSDYNNYEPIMTISPPTTSSTKNI